MPVVNIGELHIIQHNVRHYYNNIDKLHADLIKENGELKLKNTNLESQNTQLLNKNKVLNYHISILLKNASVEDKEKISQAFV